MSVTLGFSPVADELPGALRSKRILSQAKTKQRKPYNEFQLRNIMG